MNTAAFSKALNEINDSYIMEAAAYAPKKHRRWLTWGALAACLCLVLTLAVYGIGKVHGPSTAVPMYGVLAQVEEVLGSGQYRVKITGGDENFAPGDRVLLRWEGQDAPGLKAGDTVAVTYSQFKKTGGDWVITPGQVVSVSPESTLP